MNDNGPHLASYQAAHDAAGHLIAALSPLPHHIEIRCSASAPGKPRVRVYTHKNVDALHAWQAVIGGELISERWDSGQMHWLLATAVDGIPVEAWTLLDAVAEPLPVREKCSPAEVAVCARWMDAHGDPEAWSTEVRQAYANTIANARAGGAL
ncbi:hypothetical protein [Kitasatospora sp. NPDC050543]|uniref:hypothetical protein n=1 Tax=Kitasatospora sp. NPDC050543 TaxID=3364054 RepID=UPI003791E749